MRYGLLASAAVVALSCGTAMAFDQGNLTKPVERQTVVFIPKVVHPWYDVVAAGATKASEDLKKEGVEVEIIWDSPPQADVADYNRRIETNIGRHPDGLRYPA